MNIRVRGSFLSRGWVASALLLVLAAGAGYAWHSIAKSHRQVRIELLHESSRIAASLSAANLKELANADTESSPAVYDRVNSQLNLLLRAHPHHLSAQVLGCSPEGRLFCLVDSVPASEERAEHPCGIPYAGPHTETIMRLFYPESSQAPDAAILQQWKRFHILIPLVDKRKGQVFAVFATEVSTRIWVVELLLAAAMPLVFAMVMTAAVLLTLYALRWRAAFLENHSPGWGVRHMEALATGALCMLLTLFVAYELHRFEHDRQRQAFLRVASAKSAIAAEALRDIRDMQLEGLARFFLGSELVTRQEFQSYASHLSEDPAIQAWAWVPRVSREELPFMEDMARIDGLDDFQVWEKDPMGRRIPVLDRDFYCPVYYVEPLPGNEAALGSDLASEPLRRRTMKDAQRTRLATATEPVILLQEQNPRTDVVIFRPLYRPESPQVPLGYVVAVLNTRLLLEVAIKPTDFEFASVNLTLYQLQPSGPPVLLAAPHPSTETLQEQSSLFPFSQLRYASPLCVFGKVYVVTATPSALFLENYPHQAWWTTLILGGLLSTLIASLVGVLENQRFKLENQLRIRTAALLESEQRFHRLYEHSPVPYMALDESGAILEVNEAWRNELGFSRSEALGMRFSDRVAENSRVLFARQLREFQEAIDPFALEFEVTKKDGEAIVIAMTGKPVRDDSGKLLQVHYVFSNITERKRTESALQKLSTAVEQGPALVMITDTEGKIEYVNSRFTELTGYSLEEVAGNTPRILMSGETPPEVYQELWQTIILGRSWNGELHNRKKNGELYWARVSVSPIRDHTGKNTHYVSLQEDITNQRALEEQFRQSQKMESIGRLAGGMAHDFNNMLQVIVAHTDLAMEKVPSGSPLHQHLEEVMKSAQRSADLTAQLLAFARKQTASPKVQDLNELIPGMLKMLHRLIGEQIELAWMPGHELWPVKVDATQVHQVLANLLVNARDAIQGSGTITIETRNVQPDEAYCEAHPDFLPGQYVLMVVTDTGAGMDADTMTRVFEPFFTTKETGKGTGLGLATVYGIIKQNKGFIHVYSEPGHGATFRTYLPRHVLPADQTMLPPQVESPPSGYILLLVEDDTCVRTITRKILEEKGYGVISAAMPEEALLQCAAHTGDVHLLITDMIMPGMNGRELFDRLSRTRPDMKVMYMSGYTSNAMNQRGMVDGAAHFIQKPFSAAELTLKVREALGL